MRTLAFLALVGATSLLVGCGSSGGSTPPNPPSAVTPTVSQTISSGITASAALFEAVNGPDGRIWFTEFSGDKLAAVTTSGTVTEYSMPPANSQPLGIVVGPDGNLWTGGYGGVILKSTTSGATTQYPIAGAHFDQMVVGPDNNIWFTDYGNNKIGNITTAGVITAYPAPAGWTPGGIAKGSDGNLWVCAEKSGAGAIVKVTTAGAMTTYTTGLSANAAPQFMTSAPDGNLYFTEPFFTSTLNDHIGKVTTSGTITELGTLAPNTYPANIVVGKDGNLYFTEYSKPNLGKVTVSSGAVTETPLTLASGAHGTNAVVAGSDNNLWLGDFQNIYKVTY